MNISNLKNYLYLLRPEQWLKNIVIFFPAFFGLALDNFKNAILCTSTFISFCLISSSIYIVNDLIDLNKDRKHSSNSKRPIASGLISIQKAFVISLILASASLFIALQLNIHVSYLISLYFVLMVTYSLKLKNIALVDLLCIVTGFELRVFAGCWVIGHSMTVFLFVEVFLLCSLMVVSKRYIENYLNSERKTLLFYTPQKCRKSCIIVIALSVFIYILYCQRGTNIDTLSGYSKLLLSLSIISVIYGFDRFYTKLIKHKIDYNLSKTIYKDRKILLNSIAWLLLVSLAFYAFWDGNTVECCGIEQCGNISEEKTYEEPAKDACCTKIAAYSEEFTTPVNGKSCQELVSRKDCTLTVSGPTESGTGQPSKWTCSVSCPESEHCTDGTRTGYQQFAWETTASGSNWNPIQCPSGATYKKAECQTICGGTTGCRTICKNICEKIICSDDNATVKNDDSNVCTGIVSCDTSTSGCHCSNNPNWHP